MEITSYFQSAVSFRTPENQLFWRERRAGLKLAMSFLMRSQNFHMRSSDINDQNLHAAHAASLSAWLLASIPAIRSFHWVGFIRYFRGFD